MGDQREPPGAALDALSAQVREFSFLLQTEIIRKRLHKDILHHSVIMLNFCPDLQSVQPNLRKTHGEFIFLIDRRVEGFTHLLLQHAGICWSYQGVAVLFAAFPAVGHPALDHPLPSILPLLWLLPPSSSRILPSLPLNSALLNTHTLSL